MFLPVELHSLTIRKFAASLRLIYLIFFFFLALFYFCLLVCVLRQGFSVVILTVLELTP